MPTFAVILPAAGQSMRFGGGVQSKLTAELAGQPVITRAVLPFLQRSDVGQILIAVPNDPRAISDGDSGGDPEPLPSSRANEIWDALSRDPQVKNRLGGQIALVPGGSNRAQSVRRALKRVPAQLDWVAVHDAARPLLTQEVIDRTLEAAVEHGAAAPALPVALTIKRATGPLPGRVRETVARSELFAMQTPQIIRRDMLLRAFDECPVPLEQVTDDLQLLELQGQSAWLVSGDERNIKIPTPQDLALAELLLRRTENIASGRK
jgi:2-C-methyl-D-erythritol 4-phosphate cytidylyltransferase